MKIPGGLSLLRFLSILSLIFVVIASAMFFKSDLFTLGIFYFAALAALAFEIVLSIVTIIAIKKKGNKLYKTTFWLYVVSTILPLLTVVNLYKSELLASDAGLWKVAGEILGILAGLCILWYLNKTRGYFIDPMFDSQAPEIKKADKIVYIFLVLWIISGIAIAFLSVSSKMKGVLGYLKVFEGKSVQENTNYCNSFNEAVEKDNCLLSLTVMTDPKKEIIDGSTCTAISNDMVRITCYAAIEKCDLVNDQNLKATCDIQVNILKQKREQRAKDKIN